MAALTANSVAYTVRGRGGQVNDSGSRVNDLRIVFGDGVSTYPAGGIPLSNLSKCGFPNVVNSFLISEDASADGYIYKYDVVNRKLRIYQSPAVASTPSTAVPLAEVSTSFVPASNVTIYATVRGH